VSTDSAVRSRQEPVSRLTSVTAACLHHECSTPNMIYSCQVFNDFYDNNSFASALSAPVTRHLAAPALPCSRPSERSLHATLTTCRLNVSKRPVTHRSGPQDSNARLMSSERIKKRLQRYERGSKPVSDVLESLHRSRLSPPHIKPKCEPSSKPASGSETARVKIITCMMQTPS
jgi:hypothetical protein